MILLAKLANNQRNNERINVCYFTKNLSAKIKVGYKKKSLPHSHAEGSEFFIYCNNEATRLKGSGYQIFFYFIHTMRQTFISFLASLLYAFTILTHQ